MTPEVLTVIINVRKDDIDGFTDILRRTASRAALNKRGDQLVELPTHLREILLALVVWGHSRQAEHSA